MKAWFERDIRPLIDAMTPEQKQAVTAGLLASFEEARAADAAAGRVPTTPFDLAQEATLKEMRAATSREQEEEILRRYRARIKEIAAGQDTPQK
jgi:hypothetical protein